MSLASRTDSQAQTLLSGSLGRSHLSPTFGWRLGTRRDGTQR